MKKYVIALLLLMTTPLYAAVVVTLYSTQADHQKIGQITFKNKNNGLLILTDLKNLSPGKHGFHLHQHPSCKKQGMAAGDHYDPHDTKRHLGPYHSGHKGDLPVLTANKQGESKQTLFAPHLHEKELLGHAIMIHAGGDNYADHPKPLGGGGKRIACGVVGNQFGS